MVTLTKDQDDEDELAEGTEWASSYDVQTWLGKRGLVLYPNLPSSKFCVQFFTGGVAKIKNFEPQTTPLYSTLCFINIQIRKCTVAQIDPIHHNSRVGVNSFVSAFFASFHSSSFCHSNGHQTCNPRMHKKLFACSVSKQPLCGPPL